MLSLTARAQISPTVAIVPVTPNLCTDKVLTFSVSTNANPSSYVWSIYSGSGATFLSDVNSAIVSLSFTKDLTYTLTISMITPGGPLVSKKAIHIARTAVASFNASFSDPGHPTDLILTNYSSNSIKNYWNFNPENTSDSSFNSVKRYGSSGSYSVTLIAIGSKGCNDTLDYKFRISDSSSVTLPTIFTPNNDEVNDLFKPITHGLTALNCWIYNRAGYLVCKFTTVNGFWDGRTVAGELSPDGVYFVVFEAWAFDGKVYKQNGTVTLLR
ncbi:MAG: gliding motility-associated C-terminal domain-containing protein [bacterium]|nr:gliding motility-associated C-terminal domain-containing protein [bacterium]